MSKIQARPSNQCFRTLILPCLMFVSGCGEGALPEGTAGQTDTRRSDPAISHPGLAGLAGGEALDLGPYGCEDRAPGMRCETIFDYSRLNYDPINQRMLVFGGGHAATGRTDIDAFDLSTLKWSSLYPTMDCRTVKAGQLDARGFHTTTGHPVARHTYDQNVIVHRGESSSLMIFSTEGFRGTCHPYKSDISAVAAFRLGNNPKAEWSYSPQTSTPWGYAGSAEFDPVSGMVILLGGQHRGMWVYDPASHQVLASNMEVERASNSSNLLYDPLGDRMLLVDRKTLEIREFRLNRDDWAATTVKTVSTGGEAPPPFRNLAYDSHNHVIGGIQGGKFHALDLGSLTWQSHDIEERSGAGASIDSVRHHAIDYDPVNNVFILVTGKPGSLRTWAYRFRE